MSTIRHRVKEKRNLRAICEDIRRLGIAFMQVADALEKADNTAQARRIIKAASALHGIDL